MLFDERLNESANLFQRFVRAVYSLIHPVILSKFLLPNCRT